MQIKQFIVTLALATVTLSNVSVGLAAESPFGNRDPNIDISNAYQPSQIFVSTLKTTIVDAKKIEGSFTVLSQEVQDTVGSLQYRIEVSDSNDNKFIESAPVDIQSLAPGGTYSVDFSEDITGLPNGTYKFVVQILNGGGRELGWATEYITVSGSAQGFILLSEPSIELVEFNNENVAADTGPNINAGAPIGLVALATNNSDSRIVVTPEVRIYRFDTARGVHKTITLDSVSLDAHEERELHFTVPAESTPDVYITVLSLKSSNGIDSNIIQYRTVTRGAGADILSARLSTPALHKGESAFITVDFAGSADAETYFTGSMHVELEDAEGSLGQVMIGGIHMTDAIGSGMARVTLVRDMVGSPSMKVTIRDEASHVLSSRTFDADISLETLAELRNNTIRSQTISWYMRPIWALFAAAVLLVLFGCILLVRRASRMSFAQMATLAHRPLASFVILAIILANFSFVDAQSFGANNLAGEVVDDGKPDITGYSARSAIPENGIVVNTARSMASVWELFPDRQVVSLFVNRPIHNAPVGTYQCNAVPLEYRVEFGVCQNKLAQAHVIARADKNGGLQTTLDGVNANWKTVFNFMHSESRCSGALVKTKNICVVAREKSTTVNITPDAGKYSTTLQVAAKWTSGNTDHFRPVGDTTLPPEQRDVISALNLWVHCAEPARCGNAKVEESEQCDDGNQNPYDACDNTCKLTLCGDGIVQSPNSKGQQEECDDGNKNNSDMCSNECKIQVTDLTITKTAPSSLDNDNTKTFSYTLKAINNSSVPADTVMVTDAIPANFTVNTTQLPQGCTSVGNVVTCTRGTIQANGSQEYKINVTAAARTVCGQTIVNTASVWTSTQESNQGNNQATAQTSFTCTTQNGDIRITKTAPATVDINDLITYKLAVENLGDTRADNIVVRDTIPAGLTYNDAQSETPCHQVGNTVECPQIDYLSAGQSRAITLRFNAQPSVCGQTVTNTAVVTTSTPETNQNNNQSSAQTQIICPVIETDISITKTAPQSVSNDKGSTVNYTLLVHNETQTPAENVVITDAIPSIFTIGALPSNCSAYGKTITCTAGTLNANASRSFVIPVSVAARSVCGQTIPNTATVTTSTQDNNQSNNVSSTQTNFTCSTLETDVVVTKYAPPSLSNDTASTFDYRLTAINATQDTTAENVVITDTIPSAFSINSVPSGCTKNGNTVTCSVGTLIGNATREFVISVTAAARSVCSTRITNIARVTTTTPDIKPSNNETSVFTDFTCTAEQTDIAIVKTAPASVTRGDVITYQLAVTNNGPVRANDIIVRDTIPAGLTYNDAQSEAPCHQVGNTVECPQIDYLEAGQSRTIVIKFNTAQSTCGIVNNTGTVTTSTPEKIENQSNNTSSAQTQIICPVLETDIALTKTVSSPTINNDTLSKFTYTLTVSNTTQVPAEHVIITDTIPTALTIGTLPSGCIANGRTVTCSAGTLNGNSSLPFSIPVIAAERSVCAQAILNTAHVTTSTQEPNQTNNQASVQTSFTCSEQRTDLEIIKSIRGGVNIVDDIITYELKVTNKGKIRAEGIVVRDTIPAGLTYRDDLSEKDCHQVGNTVECPQIDYLEAGQSRTILIKFSLMNTFVCGGVIHNVANVATTTPDENPANNQSFVDTNVPCPLLEIKKSVPATSVGGSNVTYSFILSNKGTVTAHDVNVSDYFITAQGKMPLPFTYVSSSLGAACGFVPADQKVACHFDALAPGQIVPFTLTFSIPNNQSTCNQTFMNQVDAWPGSDRSNAAWDKAQTTVQCPVEEADLGIVKTATYPTVPYGSTIDYVLTVTNYAAVDVSNVTVKDTFPAGFKYVAQSGAACITNNGVMTCTISSIAAHGTVAIHLTLKAPDAPIQCQQNTVTNTATVSSAVQDPNLANNTSAVQTGLICPQNPTADVAVLKFGPQTVVRGNQITYSMYVTNVGPATAQGVVLSDPLPDGLTFISSSGATCTQDANILRCQIGTLSSGESTQIITATYVVPPLQTCTTASVTNVATVTATTTDPILSNNTATVTTAVTCPPPNIADLSIVKTGTLTAQYGSSVTYTLHVTNNGPSSVSSVTVADTIPLGLQYVSAVGATCQLALPSGTNQTFAGILSCDIGTLPSAAQKDIQLTFSTAAPSVCTQTSVTNSASVNEADPNVTDPNSGNNQSTASTTLTCPTSNADLSIVKTGSSSVRYGATYSYQIVATNNGSVPVQSVTVTDSLPSNLSIVSLANDSGVSCTFPTNNRGVVTCTIPTLAAGASKNISINVTADNSTGTCTQSVITNTATISENDANITDPNASNNQSSAVTTLTCLPTADVAIQKTGPTSATRGSTLTYTLTATNNGPSSAANVVIHDPFSSELTYSSASGGTCSVVGTEVQCQLGTLTSGQTVPVTLTFTVKNPSGTCYQTSINNVATITTSSTETVTSNNTSQTIITSLVCQSSNNFTVTKTDNRTSVNVGESLRYSIVITNANNAVVNNLLVTDSVPYGLTILTVSDGGQINGQQVRWTDISVPSNSSRTLFIDAQVSSSLSNNTILHNTVDVNGKQATDDTTVYKDTYNPPYNPPYYPPYTPPYTPPYNPPVYNPPVYTPPYNPPVYTPPPQVIYPQTGEEGSTAFADKTDSSNLTKVQAEPEEDSSGYGAVFYATLVAIFAAGTTVFSKFVLSGF